MTIGDGSDGGRDSPTVDQPDLTRFFPRAGFKCFGTWAGHIHVFSRHTLRTPFTAPLPSPSTAAGPRPFRRSQEGEESKSESKHQNGYYRGHVMVPQ